MKATRTVLGLAILIGGLPAWAQLITPNPDLPPLPPELPPTGGYLTADQVHAEYLGPGLDVVLNRALHRPVSLITRTPLGADERENFNSTLDFTMSVNGSPDMAALLTGPVLTEVFGKVGNVTGTFATEMLSMDLSGVTPFGPAMIRESPTLASLGQTTITDIGGGLFRIDSFFDVFTELSIDGGQSWIPDSQGPARVNLVSDVPEASTVVAGLVLAGLTAARWYRHRLGQPRQV